ncbi:hypothetical protein C3I27_03705 [Campylobacter jejuni]|uniref:Uncharacterized protein n=1 Tax=Campylobacter jejuni TaxID=197 RepID=A0AAX1Z4M7_CAMJU|nr:hypothetical protein [Campylobacter jejuni]RTI48533.1 hypothetical protein C3I27_03705 [Campylobacter jejuni]
MKTITTTQLEEMLKNKTSLLSILTPISNKGVKFKGSYSISKSLLKSEKCTITKDGNIPDEVSKDIMTAMKVIRFGSALRRESGDITIYGNYAFGKVFIHKVEISSEPNSSSRVDEVYVKILKGKNLLIQKVGSNFISKFKLFCQNLMGFQNIEQVELNTKFYWPTRYQSKWIVDGEKGGISYHSLMVDDLVRDNLFDICSDSTYYVDLATEDEVERYLVTQDYKTVI